MLEKSDLVDKVMMLIDNERRDQEREEEIRRMEEQEAIDRQHMMMAEQRAREESLAMAQQGAVNQTESGEQSAPMAIPNLRAPSPAPPIASSPSRGFTGGVSMERTGLCVVCQDAEANMALVDCGYVERTDYWISTNVVTSLGISPCVRAVPNLYGRRAVNAHYVGHASLRLTGCSVSSELDLHPFKLSCSHLFVLVHMGNFGTTDRVFLII